MLVVESVHCPGVWNRATALDHAKIWCKQRLFEDEDDYDCGYSRRLREDALRVYIPRRFKLFPYAQIGLHPNRAAQSSGGILRQQHPRSHSLGCYLQGLGFKQQSSAVERCKTERG